MTSTCCSSEAVKHRAAAEAAAEALRTERDAAREGLAKAQAAEQAQQVRLQELSAELSSAKADLDVTRAENTRMRVELAALGAARAEMTGTWVAPGTTVLELTSDSHFAPCGAAAAWEKLTAAFAMPVPGMTSSAA